VGSGLEIVAVLRGEEVVLPTPETTLREQDRILTLGTPKARHELAEHLAPMTPGEGRGAVVAKN
jgi:Trk K+ transport system NAD-binding subunit